MQHFVLNVTDLINWAVGIIGGDEGGGGVLVLRGFFNCLRKPFSSSAPVI